ncbi:MAG: SHOCT domain-containing protein [Desulfosarcinaceae bacterium]|jgi:uncharacterized membrane protein
MLVVWIYPSSWFDNAREKVEVESGGEEEDFDWRQRIRGAEGWRLVGHEFTSEWAMAWEEITIGFMVAVFVATALMLHHGFAGSDNAQAGCNQHRGGSVYIMRGWDHIMRPSAYGGMLMWLFVIIVIAVVLYLIFNRNLPGGGSYGGRDETPLDILKQRYAKGEISKEDFDRMKREIEE